MTQLCHFPKDWMSHHTPVVNEDKLSQVQLCRRAFRLPGKLKFFSKDILSSTVSSRGGKEVELSPRKLRTQVLIQAPTLFLCFNFRFYKSCLWSVVVFVYFNLPVQLAYICYFSVSPFYSVYLSPPGFNLSSICACSIEDSDA